MLCKQCGRRLPDGSVFCMYCGAPISPDAADDQPDGFIFPQRACILCGRPIPDDSPADVCDACLQKGQSSVETFTADDDPFFVPEAPPAPAPREEDGFDISGVFDDEQPEEYEGGDDEKDVEPLSRKKPKKEKRRGHGFIRRLVIVFGAIAIAAAAIWFFVLRDSAPQQETPEQRYASTYAQDIVKAAAYDPASVHFDKNTLSVKEQDGEYTITQQFERRTADGSTVQAEYTVILTLKDPMADGYVPLMLQVGDDVIYDYR